eukprot:scaffold80203_cov73-Phaeocystis_antarctica.AAC.2
MAARHEDVRLRRVQTHHALPVRIGPRRRRLAQPLAPRRLRRSCLLLLENLQFFGHLSVRTSHTRQVPPRLLLPFAHRVLLRHARRHVLLVSELRALVQGQLLPQLRLLLL